MKLTKEAVGQQWAVHWDKHNEASELFYWKLFNLAFKHCRVFSEVGVGFRPSEDDYRTGTKQGFIQWISWSLWAQLPNDPFEQESFRQHIFRSIPPGTHINAVVFTLESEADLFKTEVEKRLSWLALGGQKYWVTD